MFSILDFHNWLLSNKMGTEWILGFLFQWLWCVAYINVSDQMDDNLVVPTNHSNSVVSLYLTLHMQRLWIYNCFRLKYIYNIMINERKVKWNVALCIKKSYSKWKKQSKAEKKEKMIHKHTRTNTHKCVRPSTLFMNSTRHIFVVSQYCLWSFLCQRRFFHLLVHFFSPFVSSDYRCVLHEVYKIYRQTPIERVHSKTKLITHS